ncbi:hypothetical protein CTAYLR_003826 [Chrysophaeum taylorii]|uniref:ADP-ribosylglycohydrolase n=1 Tax=Chrysophaeum taylorii TaxID=2483200 RepID=A0AAD7UG85_9STRA|nr:hypothetical protein CTAYLR_003826 [Chrysophaeum taylorii]
MKPSSSAELEERAVAAVLGALVGDAAAVPCHWHYAPHEQGAFSEEWINPFYRVALGANSCYGDQIRCVAASMARWGEDLEDRLRDRFLAPDYAAAEPAKQAYGYRGDQRARSTPIDGPWRHRTVDRFLAGAIEDDDTSADALVRAIPAAAAAAIAGEPAAPIVDKVVVATQRSVVAREHARLIGTALSAVIRGMSPAQALENVGDLDADCAIN